MFCSYFRGNSTAIRSSALVQIVTQRRDSPQLDIFYVHQSRPQAEGNDFASILQS